MSAQINPWKLIPENADGGTSISYGGMDLLRLFRFLSGFLDAAKADINSPITIRDGRLSFTNASGKTITILLPNNASNIQLSLPPLTNSSDTLVAEKTPCTPEGWTFDGAKNNFVNVGGSTGAVSKKTGRLQPIITETSGSVGEGILRGHINMGTVAPQSDPPPYGLFWRYSTGTTQRTNCGIRYGTLFTRRSYNPRLKVRFRLPNTTSVNNSRFLFGFSSDTDIQASEGEVLDPTESGVLFGWNSGDSGMTVWVNGGTNAQTSTASPDPTDITKSQHGTKLLDAEIALLGDDTDNKAVVSVYDVLADGDFLFGETYTTNLPVLDGLLRPVFQLHNTDSGVNHDLWFHGMEMEQIY